MTRRDFFGFSAVAAASMYGSANAAENAQGSTQGGKGDFTKIINQKPDFKGKPADTIIYGHFYTAYEPGIAARAVAIKNGKFVYVGDENGVKEFKGAKTKILDYKNGVIMPGFIDGHLHGAMGIGEKVLGVDLSGLITFDETILAIKRYVNEHPGKTFIKGAGWNDTMLGNDEPTAAMLDKITDKPMVLSALSHHKDWLNTAAMKLAGIDKNTPEIKGGVITRDKDGNPLGVFKEDASLLSPNSPLTKIIPKASASDREQVILAMQDYFFSLGLTCFMDAGINLNDGDKWIESFEKLDKEGKLLIHAYAAYLIKDTPEMMSEVEKVIKMSKRKGKNFHVTNIKIFLDGVIEAGTAFLHEAYNNKPGYHGEILWKKENLIKLIVKANDAGLSVHFHSIGDAATTFALDAIEEAGKISKAKDPRNAITHLQLVKDSDFARMAKLGVVAVPDPYWHVYYSSEENFIKSTIEVIGEKRASAQYPLKSFFAAGVVTSCASDFPATLEPNTLIALQTATTRSMDGGKTQLNPKEVIDVGEAFWSATINGAYQLKAEKQIGSIEVGKDADIIVLDADVEKMEVGKLGTIKVNETMIAGKLVYKREQRQLKQGAMFF